jgi:hypothetical protein
LGTIKWQSNYCSTIWCQPKGFWTYLNFKMQLLIHFLTPFFHLGFVSLVANLQPLCGTLSELRWLSPWWRATFFTFCKKIGTP